jgi:predicted dehydrogenase
VSGARYIEAVRAGTYTFRSTDVSIVHDLMIHDLDLVLALAESPVVDVEAMGVNVFGPHADLAHAQLKLANGCIVNLNASRVSHQPQRTMRVFSPRACATIDFARNQATLVHPREDVLRRAVDLTACPTAQRRQIQETLFQDLLRVENVEVEPINAILQQQREFVASILHRRPVRVTGQQGRNALAVAEQIQESIRTHRWNGTAEGPVGPDAADELARVAPSRAA